MFRITAIVLVLAAGNFSPVTAVTEDAKLTASDAEAGDELGGSVSVDGATIVAGAQKNDDAGGFGNSGSAYVFVRSGTTWSEQAKLLASDAAPEDGFGSCVAISTDTIVVGAPGRSQNWSKDGVAYAFVRSGTTWSEQDKLVASDSQSGDFLAGGRKCAVDGDTIVVSTTGHDCAVGSNCGAAYVFVRSGTTWSEQAKLLASDGAANDSFGDSVAVSGDSVVVGAGHDDHAGGTSAGSAYVYLRSGTSWSEQAKLTASDAAANDSFGASVALSGDILVVGADQDDHAGGTDAGSAYVFLRSGTSWSEEAKLTASDAAAFDKSGEDVDLSGDIAVMGAYLDDDAGSSSGSAYVFVRSGTTWSEQDKLTASDAVPSDFFARAVGVSDSYVVAGATWDDDGGSKSGSAYVFDLPSESPGSVPDGDDVPGAPLTVGNEPGAERSQGVGEITLSWGDACIGGDVDYEIYEGILGDFSSHAAKFCTTDSLTTKTFTPLSGNTYYLLVPRNATFEGSYGTDSDGVERQQGGLTCLDQSLGACE